MNIKCNDQSYCQIFLFWHNIMFKYSYIIILTAELKFENQNNYMALI